MLQIDKHNMDFIKDNPNIVENLYDTLRIVDPIKKKVLQYNEGIFIEKGESCFSERNKKTVCDNCISMRALISNSTCMKIENIEDKTYIISAIPTNMNGKKVVVELIKDVTNSLFYSSCVKEEDCTVNNILEDMKKIAIEDKLTGLHNRRFIDERLPNDLNYCIRSGKPISVMMIDLDYFKNINDNYGHINGDIVLKKISKLLKGCLRNEKDWIARYGGEEFLVCFPGEDNYEAVKIAQKMREKINKTKIKLSDNEIIKVTASIGIYTVNNDNTTVEEILKCADNKLYEAKNSGRDKIGY
ncbi:GGDEF domain-containing protein [Clostridium intestinale]|uniref:GGDEF domain-containing protein n=1 Tax=Clostridium intestinale TaxID=36845 RepID=UPI002DD64F92|nr:GGDEF domain-containing protein [Clostridium intestinale]WRY53286.1 GGDEF domain-containing protein [Clostridium intestinale]